MGYLFLSFSLLAGKLKGYCGKRTSEYIKGFNNAIFASVIRMLLCSVIGFVLILASGALSSIVPSTDMLLISAFSGVSTAVFVVTWLICVKNNAYMMLDIFLMLSILIPLIASNIFFDESIKVTQWIGIAVLFVAVIIMCSYNNSIKSKITLSSFLLLLVCGISTGLTDFSQKLFVTRIPDESAVVFNFYTYIFATVVLIGALLVSRKTTNADLDKADIKKIFWYIFVMAVCLFASSYFKTIAAEHLSAVLLYPLNQGCALIISTCMSVTMFKEKLTVKAVIGILTAFAGLLIINLL